MKYKIATLLVSALLVNCMEENHFAKKEMYGSWYADADFERFKKESLQMTPYGPQLPGLIRGFRIWESNGLSVIEMKLGFFGDAYETRVSLQKKNDIISITNQDRASILELKVLGPKKICIVKIRDKVFENGSCETEFGFVNPDPIYGTWVADGVRDPSWPKVNF